MARAVVELLGLGRNYGPVAAVDGIDLTAFAGEFLSLLGPSGCGKTTTLNLIAGFIEPTRGRILIDGEDVTGVPAYRRGLGVVFQNYALFPHMTVFENIAFGLRMRGAGRAERERRVAEALALVRLEGYARARPAELSGGMQQRVALARALVFHPRVLLLDEPLAALDKKLREEMRAELREIQRAVRITTIFVTHDQEEALGVSDRIAVMGRGRIQQVGTPREIYGRPAARFVADFIGASNLLPVRVVAVRDGEAEVELEGAGRLRVRGGGAGGALAPGGRLDLLIRPERIALLPVDAGGPNTFPAGILSLTYLGRHTEVRVELRGGPRLLVALDEHRCPVTLAEGAAVRVALPPDAFLALAGES
ncbi:MAG TPA: ABC transporter ATP-binding protein [Candidatus Methylomirabilis sp.]